MAGPFRLQPQGGVELYETWGIRSPLESHWRPATCAELCERAERILAPLALAVPDDRDRDLLDEWYETDREADELRAAYDGTTDDDAEAVAALEALQKVTAHADDLLGQCITRGLPWERYRDAQRDSQAADCRPHRYGWRTSVPAGSDLERALRAAMRGDADGHRRHALELPQGDGFLEFLFEPGQPCLAVSTHRVPLERPALFVWRSGDWRAHTGEARQYGERADQWVDDLHTHTEKLQKQRG
jgi:hypothetical protein